MNRLSYYRKKRGLTQEQLGKGLEISKQLVSAWENGTSRIDPKYARKLGELLQLDGEVINSIIENGPSPRRLGFPGYPPLKFPVADERTIATCNTVFYPIGDWVRDHAEPQKLEFCPGRRGDFIIRVAGESIPPWYPKGSLLLVRPNVHPESGDRVIAVLSNGDVVARVFTETEGSINLFEVNGESSKNHVIDKNDRSTVHAIYQVVSAARNEEALQAMNQRAIYQIWEEPEL